MDCSASIIQAPEISDRLRENVAALADEPSYVIDRCYAAVMQVDGYANLGLSEKRDIRNSIGLFVKRWCGSILEQAWFMPAEMEKFEASVRRRVHQGISLVAILCAFRLGTKELWQAHLDLAEHDNALRDELLFVISPYLLEYSNFMTQFIGRVFLDEQFQQTSWRAEVRRQLCDLVFNGTNDDQDFCRIGRSLGFDSTVPRIALAIDYELSDVSRMNPEGALGNLVHDIARHIKIPADHVVYVTRRGRLVLWVPGACGSSLIFSQRLLLEAIIAFAKKSGEVRAIGVGFVNQGAKGWATSAEEAMTALNFALHGDGATKVYLYSDIAIDESIRSNGSALRYFESILGEILHERDLMKTLECYFDNSQHRKATAASLGIHPNTLNYRIARIETLLEAELDAPSWIARLFIALNLRNAMSVYPGGDAENSAAGTED
ncbi:PucR family transcriptional regulator [Paraburkholderia sp. NPDC080076]|uniref:PucR family transcriptional regulator n=1 Tax=Paraburkholderia sp. NPDC080076 TaxID=3390605 RepID=UPI003D039C4E